MPTYPPAHATGTVLIVDDKPENIGILFEFFSQQGYQTLIAQDGEEGVDIARRQQPDVVLMDIMMPEMDGFQACLAMQEDEDLRDIPVIFITALNEHASKLKGFEVGGVDYITKPFQQEEVLARVKTHLTLRQAHKNIALQNQLNQEYGQTLEMQIKELEGFAHVVGQELKNPLVKMSGMLKILQQNEDTATQPYIQALGTARKNMLRSVELLLLLAQVRTQEVSMETLNMRDIVSEAQYNMQYLLEKNQIRLNLPKVWPESIGHAPWVVRIWEIYLYYVINLGHTHSLTLGTDSDTQGYVRFYLQDSSPALGMEQQNRLLAPLDSVQDSHCLGFNIVRKITEKYGGEVGIQNLSSSRGHLFYFTLPSV